MSLLPARPSLFSRARSNCDLAPVAAGSARILRAVSDFVRYSREAPQYAELSAQDVRATLSHLSFRAKSRNLLLFKSRDVSTALDMTKVVWRFKIRQCFAALSPLWLRLFAKARLISPRCENLIESQIAAGIDGIIAVGTTGESPTLTHDERKEVIRCAIETANKRCLVLAGTGSYSTREAIAATEEAEKLGVDGALLVAPYYNKPSQEGLFRHFSAIAKSTPLRLMLYNIPGRCGVDIAAETVARIQGDCPNVVSIKEAGGNVDRVSELRARLPDAFTVLSGDDGLTLPFLAAGAVGVVSVASNLLPREMCNLVDAFVNGDLKRAEGLHRKLYWLFKDLFIEPNPVPIKTALSWRGTILAEVRLPLCEMSAANQARLRKTLERFEGE